MLGMVLEDVPIRRNDDATGRHRGHRRAGEDRCSTRLAAEAAHRADQAGSRRTRRQPGQGLDSSTIRLVLVGPSGAGHAALDLYSGPAGARPKILRIAGLTEAFGIYDVEQAIAANGRAPQGRVALPNVATSMPPRTTAATSTTATSTTAELLRGLLRKQPYFYDSRTLLRQRHLYDSATPTTATTRRQPYFVTWDPSRPDRCMREADQDEWADLTAVEPCSQSQLRGHRHRQVRGSSSGTPGRTGRRDRAEVDVTSNWPTPSRTGWRRSGARRTAGPSAAPATGVEVDRTAPCGRAWRRLRRPRDGRTAPGGQQHQLATAQQQAGDDRVGQGPGDDPVDAIQRYLKMPIPTLTGRAAVP